MGCGNSRVLELIESKISDSSKILATCDLIISQLDQITDCFPMATVFEVFLAAAQDCGPDEKWQVMSKHVSSSKTRDLSEAEKRLLGLELPREIANQWIEDSFFIRDRTRHREYYSTLLTFTKEIKEHEDSFTLFVLFCLRGFVAQTAQLGRDKFKVSPAKHQKIAEEMVKLCSFYNENLAPDCSTANATALLEKISDHTDKVIEILS